MVRVINAKTASGSLFGFVVEAGRFQTVNAQAASLAVPDAKSLDAMDDTTGNDVFDAKGAMILPAGVDIHIHSRDPGLTAKEDWHTVARGAYRGGVTAVADMPNTLPPTMTREAVLAKAAIARESGVNFSLLLGIGRSNFDQVAGLLADPDLPLCALKVFYGKTTGELMYDDLETLARSLPADGKKVIVFHSEDQCLVDCNQALLQGRTHNKDNASFKVHSEIRSSEAAHASTQIILDWARTTYKRPIHIAHVSTPREVEMVQEAKARGVQVTCEVAPHHLLFSTDDYERLGPLVKMNPPLRSPREVDDLKSLVGKGFVDIYATDHAPHLLAEKYTEVAHSPSGVPSLELYYPLLFEVARRTGLSAARAIDMASSVPAALFGFKGLGAIVPGGEADFVWMTDEPFIVRNVDVVSKCRWTPYDGWELPRGVRATWSLGRRVFQGAATVRTETHG